ncbi:MAG: cyclic nucleotide-binding domain-containing protein, partial [Candidatus Rokuibacteriota bacterium]
YMRHSSYRKGDVIIVEGEFTSDAYIINVGFVEVYRAGPPEQRLSLLGPGDIFGEMALISERSRSASVRALEDVEVRVFDRQAFLRVWRSDPDSMIPLVAMLCERIRILDALAIELARQSGLDSDSANALMSFGESVLHPSPASVLTAPVLFLEGLTTEATRSLPEACVSVNRFPFRIGRKTDGLDPLSQNELGVRDNDPYQVSLNHCALVRLGRRYFLIDRGSRLGTIVNGATIGGRERAGCVELKDWTNEVALGEAGTPYRFRLTIVPPEITRP